MGSKPHDDASTVHFSQYNGPTGLALVVADVTCAAVGRWWASDTVQSLARVPSSAESGSGAARISAR